MTGQVLTDASALTLNMVRAALQRHHGATAAALHGISATPRHADNAQLFQVALHHAGGLPDALLLKCCSGTFGPSEVHYYARDYVGLAGMPLVRCYDAAYDSTRNAYHLLLEDLSTTYQANWQIPPTRDHGVALAQALARLHAPYWSPAARATIGAEEPTPDAVERYMQAARPGLEPMLNASGLAASQQELIRQVFTDHPQHMRRRCSDLRGMTLVHGDVNPGNILSPRTGDGPLYLLDRQPFDWSLTVWPGASDLAYALATWWPVDVRRAHEHAVLEHYHTMLIQHGIGDYGWQQLLADYRLTAVQTLYVAAEWCANPDTLTSMRWVWQPQLERALAAIADWTGQVQ